MTGSIVVWQSASSAIVAGSLLLTVVESVGASPAPSSFEGSSTEEVGSGDASPSVEHF